MVLWRVRDFYDDDLDAAIRLWGDSKAGGEAPVFGLSDLVSAVRAHEPAVVAVVGEDLVGAAVATVSAGRAWVTRISLAAAWRNRGIGSAMLTELERRLVAAGVHRIDCLLASDDAVGALGLEHCGYGARPGMVFYEKLEPVGPENVGILGQLGGRLLRAGIWDELEGMAREKELIERRVILPLAHPELAGRLGLVPPRAVVLFGPPGTGKTTFAKGVAARLGWPFVELFPSRLAGDSPAGLAAALRESFTLVAELDKVLLFIDEVEEIAGLRQPRTVSAAQGVTNEMLKLIPPFRDKDQRLLVCATNSVRALDTALLRHGRFDYVLPAARHGLLIFIRCRHCRAGRMSPPRRRRRDPPRRTGDRARERSPGQRGRCGRRAAGRCAGRPPDRPCRAGPACGRGCAAAGGCPHIALQPRPAPARHRDRAKSLRAGSR
jgi:transitional endoplasmic reticulum ATPase